MKRLFLVLLLVSVVAVGTPVFAQTPRGGSAARGEVRGVVVGADTGQPLGSASVAVWTVADSSLVTGVVTRPDGGFRVEGLPVGEYYVRVTLLGYTPAVVDDVDLTAASPVADLGTIRLASSAVEVEGIEVTAERSAVTLAVDRTIYDTDELPASVGGSAIDLLRNVPSVEVDVDGAVSLRGNQNVAIHINGRPSPLQGEALTGFLRQLPAGMIERVEVIPNPSAKFDPEGMGGILNIVLREDTDLGTSGGVTLGAGTGGNYNASGNLGYQRGRLTLFTSYGVYLGGQDGSGYSLRENRYLDPLTYLEQDSENLSDNLSHTLNTSADLRLGERDVLSSSLLFSYRTGEDEALSIYRTLDTDRALIERYDRRNTSEDEGFSADLSLAYEHVVKPREHEFSAELGLERSRGEGLSEFARLPGEALGGSEALGVVETNDSDELNHEISFRADYTRPLTAGLRLEAGYDGEIEQIENDLTAEAFVDGELDPTAGYTNAFTFDQQVHALYGILTRDVGRFGLQAGVRVEQVLTTFDLRSGAAELADEYENDYTSVFPSASVLYEISDLQQLRASYSKRIDRPRTWLLNPFRPQDDPLNVFVGNPYLDPEYTHAFELEYQRYLGIGSLQFTPFYRRTEDVVRRIQTLDEETGVTTTTFRNLATSESYGADLTGSLRIGDRLSGFASASAYRAVTDGGNLEADLGSDALAWSARVSASFRVDPTLSLQWFQFYRAPREIEQGRVSAFSIASFAVRKSFWDDQGSVSLRVSDPFNTMQFTTRTEDENFYQFSEREPDSRRLFLSFSYTFGEQPERRERPGEQVPEMGEEPGEGGFGME